MAPNGDESAVTLQLMLLILLSYHDIQIYTNHNQWFKIEMFTWLKIKKDFDFYLRQLGLGTSILVAIATVDTILF